MFQEDYSIQFILVSIVILLNMTSYFLYYLDKKRAIKKQSRISEKTLLLITFLFGGMGACMAMKQFRHKTKNRKFKLFVPFAVLITVGTFYFIIRFM